MVINNSQRAFPAAELKQTMTGSWVLLGTLDFNPVIMIMDNLGTVEVEVSFDGGTTTWKTFSGGEALVLDFRANHGIASNFTLDKGISVYANGASGDFSISYLYAKEM